MPKIELRENEDKELREYYKNAKFFEISDFIDSEIKESKQTVKQKGGKE